MLGQARSRPVRERDPIDAAGQDVLDGAVAGDAELEGAGAGGLDAPGPWVLLKRMTPKQAR